MSYDKAKAKETIKAGKAVLGLELGSTRIKAVLIDGENQPIASGSHDWENQLVNGVWTYSMDAIWGGLQDCYSDLAADVKNQYDTELTSLAGIGFSAMMHGYLAFKGEELLVPFRTWRNTITEQSAAELSRLFHFNIPQRWSIAHLYQAILNDEKHVKDIDYITTLSGYVHWQMTGEKVLGIGDASGMFPVDSAAKDYDQGMVDQFDALVAPKGYPWKLRDILPKVLSAGEDAGFLTEEGAKKLDVSGKLKPGIPVCPPEGDAGTGMTATNSCAVRTGNVSAGTSVFAMIVLEKPLSKPYPEIDMVTTPTGDAVAMVHCNNCTSDLNAWVGLFREFCETCGIETDMDQLFETLYNKSLEGDRDCGGIVAYNYFAGEPVTGMNEGRPLLMRKPDAKFTLANFMRSNLYASLATLKVGLDLLLKNEDVQVDKIMGHGGLFKTKGVGQGFLAAAMNSPVSVMETAGEGGPWGMALLASYQVNKKDKESLNDFLNHHVFANCESVEMQPDPADAAGFDAYIESYKAGLAAEKAAVETF